MSKRKPSTPEQKQIQRKLDDLLKEIQSAEELEKEILNELKTFLSSGTKIPYFSYQNTMIRAITKLDDLKRSGLNLYGFGLSKKQERINKSLNSLTKFFQIQAKQFQDIKRRKIKKYVLKLEL